MFQPAVVALLPQPFDLPTVAWRRSFNLKSRPEIQIASNNLNVRVDASDRKDS